MTRKAEEGVRAERLLDQQDRHPKSPVPRSAQLQPGIGSR